MKKTGKIFLKEAGQRVHFQKICRVLRDNDYDGKIARTKHANEKSQGKNLNFTKESVSLKSKK